MQMQFNEINGCKQFTNYEEIKRKGNTINYKNIVFLQNEVEYTFTDDI